MNGTIQEIEIGKEKNTWKKLLQCGSTRSTWAYCFYASPVGSGSWRTAIPPAEIN